jgi:hypothetical protein
MKTTQNYTRRIMSIEKTMQTSLRLDEETLTQLKAIKRITGKSIAKIFKPLVASAYGKALDHEISSLEAQEKEIEAKQKYLEIKMKVIQNKT